MDQERIGITRKGQVAPEIRGWAKYGRALKQELKSVSSRNSCRRTSSDYFKRLSRVDASRPHHYYPRVSMREI
jgi:hypothetical protein